jgi:MFS family permease
MDRPQHPFRIANFRSYWLSRLSGTIAQTALAIVIGWQVYGLARETMDIRQAAFLLGMIGAAQFVPLFLLTPVTGLIADSLDRRYIVRATTALTTVVTAALGLLTYLGALSLPALFVAAVLIGVSRAFTGPAYSALAPNLVPRTSLPTAIAISSIAWQVGTIAGPSVGGLLYAIHPDVAYATITGLFLLAEMVSCDTADTRPRIESGVCSWISDWRAFTMCGTTGWCWPRSRSTFSSCCWPGRPRCCPSMPATSCMSGRRGWARWRRAWGSARPRPPSSSRSGRCGPMSASRCWARSSSSRSPS